jgi:TolB-like protein
MQRFLSELQRRKVLRVAAGYAVVGWIVLQVTLALQTALKLPDSFATIVLSLLIISFPVALALSWLFEFTPLGIKRTVPASGDGALVKAQTSDLILAGALLLVVIVAVVQLLTPAASTPDAATRTSAVAEAEEPKPEPPRLGDNSIAVLPFANLSPDKENEFFADGLTEELLNLLAKIGDLKVISRTSSFAFKGQNTPLPEIAKQLGVRHILEGSVRAKDDDLRVTAQLIDVATDTHLWSETYERKMDDVFALQDEIARDIANALDIELAVVDAPNSAPTSDLAAYRLHLEARELWRSRKAKEAVKSVELYRQAIARDPNFAEAYAGLALSLSVVLSGDTPNAERYIGPMREAAEKAIALKPSLAQPHAVRSLVARYDLDWEAAEAHIAKAESLDPSDYMTLFSRGMLESSLGYVERAALSLDKAHLADPLFRTSQWMRVAIGMARSADPATVEVAKRLTRLNDEYAPFGHIGLATQARLRNDPGEAETHVKAWLRLRGFERAAFAAPMIAGMKSKAAIPQAIRAIGKERANNPKLGLAPYIMLGAEDEVIDGLNRELKLGNKARLAIYLTFIWGFHGGSSGFKDLVRDIGLVDYWKKRGWPDKCRAKGEDDFECS